MRRKAQRKSQMGTTYYGSNIRSDGTALMIVLGAWVCSDAGLLQECVKSLTVNVLGDQGPCRFSAGGMDLERQNHSGSSVHE